MTRLAYLVAGLSLSVLTACQSEDTKVAQKPETSLPVLTAELPTMQTNNSSIPAPDFQALQTQLASLQQRLQTAEASLAQSQTELSRKSEQLQALQTEQQRYTQQQVSLDGTSEQIKQLEQQLTQKDQQLSKLESSLIQVESECQQAKLRQPAPKQIAELEPSKIEH
ncbi:hypothetical protein [uncultured Thiothrix sp.]|uniref:hypothetical protein n=1 Tax=uncultured Thiothrix sp. TaxID=223185 RepID=UPI00260B4747|nr:hypothetical protein [uncultured Thiothrix sp.]